MDAIDLKILASLQRDSSLINVELARRVHLSPVALPGPRQGAAQGRGDPALCGAGGS